MLQPEATRALPETVPNLSPGLLSFSNGLLCKRVRSGHKMHTIREAEPRHKKL